MSWTPYSNPDPVRGRVDQEEQWAQYETAVEYEQSQGVVYDEHQPFASSSTHKYHPSTATTYSDQLHCDQVYEPQYPPPHRSPQYHSYPSSAVPSLPRPFSVPSYQHQQPPQDPYDYSPPPQSFRRSDYPPSFHRLSSIPKPSSIGVVPAQQQLATVDRGRNVSELYASAPSSPRSRNASPHRQSRTAPSSSSGEANQPGGNGRFSPYHTNLPPSPGLQRMTSSPHLRQASSQPHFRHPHPLSQRESFITTSEYGEPIPNHYSSATYDGRLTDYSSASDGSTVPAFLPSPFPPPNPSPSSPHALQPPYHSAFIDQSAASFAAPSASTIVYHDPVLEAAFHRQDSLHLPGSNTFPDEPYFLQLPPAPELTSAPAQFDFPPSNQPSFNNLDICPFATSSLPHPSNPLPPLSRPSTGSTLPAHPHHPYSPLPLSSAVRRPPRAAPADAPPPDEAQTLAFAALQRALHKSSEPPFVHPARAKPTGNDSEGTGADVQRKRTEKLVELDASCWTCGNHLSLLRLRGKDLSNLIARSKATCLACIPIDIGSPSTVGGSAVYSYEDTISAAIDQLEGITLGTVPKDTSNTPVQPTVTSAPAEEVQLPNGMQEHASKCDVCGHLLGVCEISARAHDPSKPTPPYTVETICARCIRLFKPCSDCGGGGGRLTSGRWRSIELFPDGRKTCRLLHARFPSLNEISYSCRRISEITVEKMNEYDPILKRLYFDSRLGVLARPEYLTVGDGLATTFEQAERTTTDTWNLIAPLLHERSDSTDATQRYLTLMIAAPRGRRPGSALPDKSKQPQIIGFLLSTVKFDHNTCFIAVAIPWAATGTGFDALTRMGEEMTRFYQQDRHRLNEARREVGFDEYTSPITCNFFCAPFRRDSKMSAGIERRGYLHLDDYLRQHPNASPLHFPPHREIWIPKRWVTAMQTWVRPLDGEHDMGGPPPRATKRREEAIGRRKGRR